LEGSATDVAVIVAVPTPTPVTVPFETVATAEKLVVHVTAVFVVPVTVALSGRVVPMSIVRVAALRATVTG
jgi:hypothetical protein